MDWKELGKKVVSAGAPLLGGALGGPGGAAVGALLASLFKAKGDDPKDILKAMSLDPEHALKLQEMEFKHKEMLERMALERTRIDVQSEVAIITSVNASMQTEAKSEKWPQYSWRPFWGFSSGIAFLFCVLYVCAMAYRAVALKDTAAMNMIPQILTSFSTLFAIAGAVLGITTWGRNKLKIEQAKGEEKGAGA
ncbi:MAG: 3TM-type holin [Thermodesulfobacteriota bacterium]